MVATTHRPLLLLRGRALFEHDPTEWGGVSLEVLYKTLVGANMRVGTWLRRRVSGRLARDVYRATRRHLAQQKHEPATDPSLVIREGNTRNGQEWIPHLEASADLELALSRMPAATRDGLLVAVTGECLADVARAHGLSYAALRQRVSRARRELRDQLARYHRAPQAGDGSEETSEGART
jgi:DNA-directed RNA polymerase specialized sigma24 family protein